MKEFEGVFQEKDKMELSIQKKQQKEKVLVGKLVPHKGHKIWEINEETLEIKLAEFEKKTYIIGKNHANPEIIIRIECAYVSALNSKNALKKYKQGVNGSKELGTMSIKLF
jgi:hypothetical protein